MSDIPETKQVQPTEFKKVPFTWKFLVWIAYPCLAFGIYVVYLGWDALMNKFVNNPQLAAGVGVGNICVGIAAILLGGIGVLVDVLVKTRIK